MMTTIVLDGRPQMVKVTVDDGRYRDKASKLGIIYVMCKGFHVPQRELRRVADITAAGLGTRVVRFNQYAGCTCGCSPGFMIEGTGKVFNVTVKQVAS